MAWSDAVSGIDSDIFAQLVDTGATVAVDPGSAAPVITFARPSPNPARGPIRLGFALPRAAVVRLAIYDVGGRRVRDLLSGAQPAGRHELVWDQLDEGGRQVPAGVCFARLEVEGRAMTHKLTTVR